MPRLLVLYETRTSFDLSFLVYEVMLTLKPSKLPMFSFTGNKKSVAGGGANTFYGKSGINFYTQTKTVTSLWKSEDAVAAKASVEMPTHS